jgi:hypothetical protein
MDGCFFLSAPAVSGWIGQSAPHCCPETPSAVIPSYMPQFTWFADNLRDAVNELVAKEFLVGLVHR